MKPLVSVIVPVYNVEEYLPRCIESILNQTYKNLEIILVNDGSPDQSGEICDAYAQKDSRIQVIHQENRGVSAARNTGLDRATGEYVSFIDSDDYIHRKFYEVLVTLALEHDADIVQCSFEKVYQKTSLEMNQVVHTDALDVSLYNNIQALNNIYSEQAPQTVIVCNKIFKRQLFANIRFPVGKFHEDEYMIVQLLYQANKTAVTSVPLYFYFQHPGSIMGREFNTNRLDALQAYVDHIAFFEKKGLPELKRKAIARLEELIRIYMMMVLRSNHGAKDRLFQYLHDFYKEKAWLFTELTGRKSRLFVTLLTKSPTNIAKLFIRVLNKRLLLMEKRRGSARESSHRFV